MLSQPAKLEEPFPPQKGGLIYVVDDEVTIGEIVSSILEMEGFEVMRFSDPVSALDAFTTADSKPDLLVTDYVMTPMNGMELIHKFRAICPTLRTILYSGNVTHDITEIYVIRPDAFIEKPFLPKTLVAMVRTILFGNNQ